MDGIRQFAERIVEITRGPTPPHGEKARAAIVDQVEAEIWSLIRRVIHYPEWYRDA